MSTKNTLPLMCYVQTECGETVAVCYGDRGYFKNALCETPNGEQRDVDELNERVGVTKEQVAVMTAGSMFGWNIPLVTNYIEGY